MVVVVAASGDDVFGCCCCRRIFLIMGDEERNNTLIPFLVLFGEVKLNGMIAFCFVLFFIYPGGRTFFTCSELCCIGVAAASLGYVCMCMPFAFWSLCDVGRYASVTARGKRTNEVPHEDDPSTRTIDEMVIC